MSVRLGSFSEIVVQKPTVGWFCRNMDRHVPLYDGFLLN